MWLGRDSKRETKKDFFNFNIIICNIILYCILYASILLHSRLLAIVLGIVTVQVLGIADRERGCIVCGCGFKQYEEIHCLFTKSRYLVSIRSWNVYFHCRTFKCSHPVNNSIVQSYNCTSIV